MTGCERTCSFLVTPFTPIGFNPSHARRRGARCNINRTSDSSREDEVAAKIAQLRKQKRLKSQKSTSSSGDRDNSTSTSGSPGDASKGLSYDELPDWKKQEVLESQIADAEKFFYRKPSESEVVNNQSGKPSEQLKDYKPRVSTWGVFPRPDNISKTFGGGRRIQTGGVKLDTSDSIKSDEAVKKKLAAYRASRGMDMEKEEKHEEEIETALRDASDLMKRTLPYEAIEKLEGITDFTSERSRRGGKVFLSLALAYEAVGKREDAREIYMKLRKNTFPEISSKAKQLLQGFAAMEKLQIDDETRSRGYRVANFALPDFTRASDKRYETVVFDGSGKNAEPEKVSLGTSAVLFAVLASPALILLALLVWRR